MGPTWGQQDPSGPHVGHMNFAILTSYIGEERVNQWLQKTNIFRNMSSINMQTNGSTTVDLPLCFVILSFPSICLIFSIILLDIPMPWQNNIAEHYWPYVGDPTVSCELFTQRAINVENVFMSWRPQVIIGMYYNEYNISIQRLTLSLYADQYSMWTMWCTSPSFFTVRDRLLTFTRVDALICA